MFVYVLEAVIYSETSVILYQTTRCHITKDSRLYSQNSDNVKSLVTLTEVTQVLSSLCYLKCDITENFVGLFCYVLSRCTRMFVTIKKSGKNQIQLKNRLNLCVNFFDQLSLLGRPWNLNFFCCGCPGFGL